MGPESEYGSIERAIRIDAAPEIVFDVVSDPAQVQQWWPDEARYEVAPGGAGEIVFSNAGEKFAVAIQVVDAIPYRLFSFRWTHPAGEEAKADNSFLVTFELEPADGGGTLLRMTETGFREHGWEAAVLEEAYREHAKGWDYHLTRLVSYVARYQETVR